MKVFKTGLFAMAALLGTCIATAQTADEIIAKSIDAIGGRDKISKINSIYMETSMDIMGTTAEGTTTILNGKGFKNEINFNGQKVVQCVTDTGGWMINPMMGQTTATSLPAEQVKAAKDQLDIGGPLFNYAKKGNKVEMAGKEDIQGVSAFKIKLMGSDSMESTFYIDPVKYYVIKSIMKRSINGQDMEVTALYSDYQKTDYGFMMPFSTELQLPQFTIKNTTKKVEINKPVDPNIFKAS